LKRYFLQFYNFLFILSPWVVFVAMLQFHFQSFLPYQGIFKGQFPFDYWTVVDLFVMTLFIVFFVGVLSDSILINKAKIPLILWLGVFLLVVSGILQIFLQEIHEPILNAPFEYFRSLFLYPIIFVLLLYKTLKEEIIEKIVISYIIMVGIFAILALIQHFFGIFPGEQKDFTGRLAWPFVDYITLKSSSANWAAFFATPALIISFIQGVNLFVKKNFGWKLWLFLSVAVLSATVVYLTQSYGAYAAVFLTLSFFLFRKFSFKKFIILFLLLVIAGGGIYLLQKNSYKFKILTNQIDFKYETSATSRKEIFKMNWAIIKERPVLGVGLNQYQSYFKENQEKVLGHKLNESHIPPHAHNFFMSFWTNLGVFGFLGILLLIIGVFWHTKFLVGNPFVFVILAIMIHGLIDSYYWSQSTAYFFWMMIVLAHVFRSKNQ